MLQDIDSKTTSAFGAMSLVLMEFKMFLLTGEHCRMTVNILAILLYNDIQFGAYLIIAMYFHVLGLLGFESMKAVHISTILPY